MNYFYEIVQIPEDLGIPVLKTYSGEMPVMCKDGKTRNKRGLMIAVDKELSTENLERLDMQLVTMGFKREDGNDLKSIICELKEEMKIVKADVKALKEKK